MLYMLAKNTEGYVFAELVDHLKYPNYHHSQESLDRDNRDVLREHQYRDDVDLKPQIIGMESKSMLADFPDAYHRPQKYNPNVCNT